MKTLILVLALTLAAAQPLTAWEADISNEGANTAEEVRRLREDLKEARDESRREKKLEELREKGRSLDGYPDDTQDYILKNLYGFDKRKSR